MLATHLRGEAHIGLYPLLDGDRYWWLAADWDGPDALPDALMYVKAARLARQQIAAMRRKARASLHTQAYGL